MGWLTSSIVNVNNYPHWDELQWEDSVPPGSFLGFRVRSSNDPADMGEWSGYIEEPGSLEGFVDSTHRYLQYRVVMESGGRFITPSLDDVIFLWDWLGVEGTEDVTRLHPVTPNPLYGPVELRFSLAEPGPVTIRVFDLCGRVVASPVDGEVSGGEHSVQLASLPPGAYFVRMTAGEERSTGALCSGGRTVTRGCAPLNGDEPFGDPNGARTRVTGVKGRCPNHWTMGSPKNRPYYRRQALKKSMLYCGW